MTSKRSQYPRRRDEDDDDLPVDESRAMLEQVRDFASKDLATVGLEKVAKLERIYGKDDLRVKKAKLEAFFNAYAILGTIRYAAQVCGLNPKAVSKIIKANPEYQRRFELAHEEFCEYLEQTAIVRAVTKSDSLLQFLLRANNPRKFSERMRIQALTADQDDDKPLTLAFGEYSQDWDEPNYALAASPDITITNNKEEVEDDS